MTNAELEIYMSYMSTCEQLANYFLFLIPASQNLATVIPPS